MSHGREYQRTQALHLSTLSHIDEDECPAYAVVIAAGRALGRKFTLGVTREEGHLPGQPLANRDHAFRLPLLSRFIEMQLTGY